MAKIYYDSDANLDSIKDKVIGVIGASEAPAIIMSFSPSWMASKANPTESVPAVQPVEIVLQIPFKPYLAATSLEGVLNIEAS